MHKIRQDRGHERHPLCVLGHLGALGTSVRKIVVGPEENNRIQDSGFLGPATDQSGITRDDVQAIGLINFMEQDSK